MQSSLVPRRSLLRAAGVSLSLPFFPSLKGTIADGGAATSRPVKRMVCIGNMLGFYPNAFWPTTGSAEDRGTANAGRSAIAGLRELGKFEWGQTTASLEAVRDRVTVLEGLDHGLKGGHFAIHAFLSGVRQIDAKSMPTANVTIDQVAANAIPGQTRFPTLNIGSESGIHGGCQLSWTASGTRVPPIPGPQQLFQQLFVGSSQQAKAAQAARFQMQNSILDTVLGDAKDLKQKLNQQDEQKFDEYLSSVRDVEKRIELRRNWIDIPKPDAPFEQPKNRNMVQDLPLLYDLIVLALQSDSTRIATLEIGGDFNPKDLGISGGYHAFSHHGQRAEAIDALIRLERYQVEHFVRFVSQLAEKSDEHGPLLDQTSVLFGSGMGNANSHTNSNLPLILAGGSYRHGRLLQYDQQAADRPPLTNLYLSMLQEFGVETDRFATSTGTLRGLV